MATVNWRDDVYRQRMVDWAQEALGRKVSFETVKDTDMSLVLRASDGQGTNYLKTVYAGSAFEAALTAYLATAFPDRTVEVFAADWMENWLLLRELPGELLRVNKDECEYAALIGEWAEFQQRTIPLTGELLALGVPDRRLPVLKREINDHLEAMCATGLTEQETAAVLALKPELLAMCDEMTGVLPDALDHGDLHSANAVIEEGACRLFDWGDAAITHPFLSVRVFWNSLAELLEEDTEENWMKKITGFRPLYLKKWKGYAQPEVLDRQLHLAEQIGCLYRALSWHLYITPFREDRIDSFKRPAQWLRLLLNHRKYVS